MTWQPAIMTFDRLVSSARVVHEKKQYPPSYRSSIIVRLCTTIYELSKEG